MDKRTPEQTKGQDGQCATVRVVDDKAEQGFVVIDAHQFDEKVHEVYKEPPAKKEKDSPKK